uniref:Uncharacterized protein n=1 Tax=Arundo donax TaxID=35708 RepID=A0A0A9DS70_ARUDO
MAAAPEPCSLGAGAFVAAVEGVSLTTSSSASEGLRSRRRTNPEGAAFTGSYLLPCRNFMNFSWAGTTRAGLVRIWNVGSGSGAFFSAAPSTCMEVEAAEASSLEGAAAFSWALLSASFFALDFALAYVDNMAVGTLTDAVVVC